MLEWNKKEAPLKALAGMGGGVGRGPISGGSNDYTLVWSMDESGSVHNNYTTHTFATLAEDQSGVNFTSYSNIPTGWDRLVLTSKNRGTVWTFANNADSRRWLESLCNPISSWTASKNTRYDAYPREGSSRYATTGSLYQMIYQHNNGGTETHDICTLGNSGNDVWQSGMYWGNIDAQSNYGGLMNQYNATSGSGGGNTGDTLYAYVQYNHSTTASDYTNYLTPTGPLGNATQMTWSRSGGNGGFAGTPEKLADAVDRNTTSGWDSYGCQQGAQNGSYAWMKVDLGAGNKTAFDYTFAIGYPNASHDSDENFIEASNNDSDWVKMAEWGRHNNNLASDYGRGYLFHNDGSWVYSDALTYMGVWHAIKNRTEYRYWRIGGTSFNWSNGNQHQLLMNWALLKKT